MLVNTLNTFQMYIEREKGFYLNSYKVIFSILCKTKVLSSLTSLTFRISMFMIYLMVFVIAMRQMGRFAGFSLFVSNTSDRHHGYLCYKNGPDQGLPPLDFNTNCIAHGRYVMFYNERMLGKNYSSGYVTRSVFTELCEVTVIGILLIFFNCYT